MFFKFVIAVKQKPDAISAEVKKYDFQIDSNKICTVCLCERLNFLVTQKLIPQSKTLNQFVENAKA